LTPPSVQASGKTGKIRSGRSSFSTVEPIRPIEEIRLLGISLRPGGPERGGAAEESVNEPIYRWECTFCDAAGVSESSEMARLTIDAHVAVAHPDQVRERRSSDAGSERAT
jgi:hypothetical protein